jgi:hypothetical protein
VTSLVAVHRALVKIDALPVRQQRGQGRDLRLPRLGTPTDQRYVASSQAGWLKLRRKTLDQEGGDLHGLGLGARKNKPISNYGLLAVLSALSLRLRGDVEGRRRNAGWRGRARPAGRADIDTGRHPQGNGVLVSLVGKTVADGIGGVTPRVAQGLAQIEG